MKKNDLSQFAKNPALGFTAEQHREDAQQREAGHEGGHPVEAAAERADQKADDEPRLWHRGGLAPGS
jgi:hypothetical protein